MDLQDPILMDNWDPILMDIRHLIRMDLQDLILMGLQDLIPILWLQVDIQWSLLQVFTQVHTNSLHNGVPTKATTKARMAIIMEVGITWLEH